MSEEKPVDETDGNTSTGVKPQLIPGCDSFDDFIRDGYKAIIQGIRNANTFLIGTDFGYYETHQSFTRIMNEESNAVMRSINSILKKYDIHDNIKNRGLEEKTELIVEANDTILEQAANNIDEMNGIKKNPQEAVVLQEVSVQLPVNGSWNRITKARFSVASVGSAVDKEKNSQDTVRLLTGKNIVRPQSFFKDKIDNSNSRPWEPRIKEKPNSLKPLAIFLEETENGEEFSHPYEFELDKFEPSLEQLKASEALDPKPLLETPLVEVTTEEGLNSLLNELYNYKEIAIDLEHHSYRTFMGITCLMQISTRDKDYLVDTLVLRDKLAVLNEVFTKPTIVKVFHGADMDIQWLQRDLSLYIVNLFDTHQAAKQLEYSGLSLAYLLNRFCDVQPNKHFQLADWRIRPLPEELKMYAREDTHYLLYIYDKLKEELLKKANGNDNLLKAVYQKSTDICKRRYFKPMLKEDSHLEFYKKCKRLFDNRQMYALKELYKWRDTISREEDESTGYVLPNHMLLQIAEALPREMQGVLACCNPIPPLVRANLLELHQIILSAREQSLEKPILKEENRSRGSTQQIFKINVDSPLHCPHDLSKNSEFRDDLPTLLNKTETVLNFASSLDLEQTSPVISVFDSPEDKTDGTSAKLKNLKFLGPYDRYKLVKPFVEAAEAKAAAEREAAAAKIEEGDRSVEERISELHEHYVQTVKDANKKQSQPVAKEISEKVADEAIPLIQMGGSSKKRKHRELEDDPDYHPNYNFPENELHTPVPNIKKQNRWRGRGKKRQFFESNEKDNKKRRTDGCGNNQQQQQQQPQKQQQQPKKQQQQPQKGRWRNKRNKDQGAGDQQQNSNQGSRQPQNRPQTSRGQQRQQQFQPFDYASVDYNQFRGGGKSVAGTQKPNTSFKNKGGRKQNKGKFNTRSITFGNNQGSKKRN